MGIIDGRIVAMGALKRLTDTRGEICRMRVHPNFQRRGLGRRMLSILEERARELGFRTLTLDTTVGQVAAMGMYRKARYEEVARDRKFGFDGRKSSRSRSNDTSSPRSRLFKDLRSQAVPSDHRPVVLHAETGALRHGEVSVHSGVELVDIVVRVYGDIVGVRAFRPGA